MSRYGALGEMCDMTDAFAIGDVISFEAKELRTIYEPLSWL